MLSKQELEECETDHRTPLWQDDGVEPLPLVGPMAEMSLYLPDGSLNTKFGSTSTFEDEQGSRDTYDICAKCFKRKGDLVVCDFCPLVWHHKCISGRFKFDPDLKFRCHRPS